MKSKTYKKGEKLKPQKGVYLADVEMAGAIFTKSRMKIIHALKSKGPKSIYTLTKLLQRDFKNVYRRCILSYGARNFSD